MTVYKIGSRGDEVRRLQERLKRFAALNSDKEELMTFSRSIQHPVKHYIYEPWKGMFKSLGRTEEFQGIQVKYAGALYKTALKLCREYGLWSERAAALMFDIKVQNGSISNLVKTRILSEFNSLPSSLSREGLEIEKMRVIANGGGVVHGINYDLEGQFGVRMVEV